MKRKSFFFTFALLCANVVYSQDRLITKDGDVIDAYRIDIANTCIYYVKENNINAPVQKIAKSEVLMIKKKDGTKIDVANTDSHSESEENTKVAQPPVYSDEQQQEINVANKKMIGKRNKFNIEFNQSKAKNKPANLCVLGYELSEESVIFSGDLMIYHTFPLYGSSTSGKICPPFVDLGMLVNIINQSEKTVYIDLANSFIVRGNNSESLYVPSSTTSSTSSSTGVGVNMGAVSNALGVGGVAGTLAQGVNIGKGSSTVSTTTVYSQRIIAIPPKSTKAIPVDYLGKGDGTSHNWFRAEKFKFSYKTPNTNLLHFKFEKNLKSATALIR